MGGSVRGRGVGGGGVGGWGVFIIFGVFGFRGGGDLGRGIDKIRDRPVRYSSED